MKILVVGGGCREHALIKSLKEDPKTEQIYTLPERPSLQGLKNIPSSLLNKPRDLADYLLKEGVELVLIGPEKPLVDGLADVLRERGLKVFGPSQKAAQLEGSKIFAKKFMKELGIPTASYHIVNSVAETLKLSENFFPPYVLKADGLVGGKGVFICKTQSELEEKSQFLFEEKGLGRAGEKALLEDFQKGRELSVFVLTNGESYQILPVAQDYKRLHEANKGPNTGGMGAIAPLFVEEELLSLIEARIIKPTLKGLKKRQWTYCGILYLGLMVHKKIPKVLEYNVRWGDPEAQVLLPLLEGSWLDVFHKTALGKSATLKWKQGRYSACVVLANAGYPESPSVSAPIEGSIYARGEHSYFIHGSLEKQKEKQEEKKATPWRTKGGRVLNAVGLGTDMKQAIQKAYEQAGRVSWPGMQYRKDIGRRI